MLTACTGIGISPPTIPRDNFAYQSLFGGYFDQNNTGCEQIQFRNPALSISCDASVKLWTGFMFHLEECTRVLATGTGRK